jgi:hypothetical protein
LLRITCCIASLAAALALAAPAVAAPAGNGGGSTKSSSSIILVQPAAATTSGWPRYGDQVSFAVSTAAANPYVNLQCFRNGALVAQGWANLAYADPTFTLSSPSWTGGDADCTASLDSWSNARMRTLASTSFHVSA